MAVGQGYCVYMLMEFSTTQEPPMTNIATLADRATILDTDIKVLTKEFNAIKSELKDLGAGTYEGDIGSVTVRQNADSETFDAAAAFEYIADQLSPQLLSAVRRKFTITKAGAVVLTVKPKVVKRVEA